MSARRIALSILLAGSALLFAQDRSWLRKVPAGDRARVNPYEGDAVSAAAGKILFADHCTRCHGADARGRHNRPSLRSEHIAHATDGELAWILKNGYVWKGMPSWSALPEPERWQIITYLRSLAQGDETEAAHHNNHRH